MHVIGDSQFVCALCWLYFLMLAALQQCFGSAVAQHDLLVLLVLCVWVCHGVSDRGRGRTGFVTEFLTEEEAERVSRAAKDCECDFLGTPSPPRGGRPSRAVEVTPPKEPPKKRRRRCRRHGR